MSHAVNLTHGRKEGFTIENLKEYVLDGFNKFFCAHIPVESIQEMPKFYMYLFGLFAYFISFVLFFFFIYDSYTSAIEQPFMSLQNGPLCDSVTVNVTQELMADVNGLWLGQPGFQYQYCIYTVELDLFSGTTQDFTNGMDAIYEEITVLGKRSETNNLAINLIYWLNYVTEVPAGGSTVKFYFSGDTNVAYNLKYFHGQVSCELADCPLTSLSSYDMANSLLMSEYNYTEFVNNPECVGAVNPYSLGYVGSIDGSLLKFTLDVQSFQLAIGVNLGVVPLAELVIVPGTNQTAGPYYGVTASVAAFFSYRTPYMAPIYCIHNVSGVDATIQKGSILDEIDNDEGAICLVNIGDIYGLPVFNSWGASTTEPVYCDCETGVGYEENCDDFDFISGILFYNSPITSEVVNKTTFQELLTVELAGLVVLMNKTKNYETLNRNAYNASWASSFSVDDKVTHADYFDPLFKEPAWRKTAYEFCEISVPFNKTIPVDGHEISYPASMTCSLITFNTFDPVTRAVSQYKYQLEKGSCKNTFTVPNATWYDCYVRFGYLAVSFKRYHMKYV
jgi:hypothetical protein